MTTTQRTIEAAITAADAAMRAAQDDEERADYNRVANDLARIANDVMRIEAVKRRRPAKVETAYVGELADFDARR